MIQSVFEKANQLAPAERAAYVRAACADDQRMIDEVTSLLASVEPSEAELERSPLLPLSEKPTQESLPEVAIEGYEVISELHRGGQGVVYSGIQLSTQREVAIKFMLAGALASPANKRRFQREVELASALRHPGIVPIFDSGLARGQYYYAMELIDGVRLDQFIRERRLSVRETLALFAKVCEAVNYAHQNGVMHRDLKPSNILVDQQSQPHILDFGLAKLQTQTGDGLRDVSMTGQVMGTLAYMSPEQASGDLGAVDIRSDVYSLGVILFEAITGELPYQLDSSLAENLSKIKSSAPKSISASGIAVGSEISTIVAKALHKEKDRRYQTAGSLGKDVTRFLAGEPIEAKRDSTLYLLRKTIQRNIVSASVALAFLALLVVSSIVTTLFYFRAVQSREAEKRAANIYRLERDGAITTAQKLTQTLYFAEMNIAGQEMQNPGGVSQVRSILNHWKPQINEQDLRGWEWHRMSAFCSREKRIITGHRSTVWSVDWSADGTQFVSAAPDDNELRIWDASSGTKTSAIKTHAGRWVTWSPDGKRIASCSFDGEVYIWDTKTGKPMHRLLGHQKGSTVRCVCWNRDGTRLASTGNDGRLCLWDARSGKIIRTIECGDALVASACWSPDGNHVAVGHYDGTSVYRVNDGEKSWDAGPVDGSVQCVAWSENQSQIASCEQSGGIQILDAVSGDSVKQFRKPNGGSTWCVAWHPNRKWLVAANEDRTLNVWDTDSARRLQTLHGHDAQPVCVRWSPDGKQMISAGLDQSLRVWDVETNDRTCELKTEHEQIGCIDWSPNRNRLASAGVDRMIRIWDVASRSAVRTIDATEQPEGNIGEIVSVRWSPDGQTIAAAGQDHTVRLWDTSTGSLLRKLHGHRRRSLRVAWHPDGRLLASGGGDAVVHIWDTQTGKQVTRFSVGVTSPAIQWSRDGKRLAVGCADSTGPFVSIRSAATFKPLQRLQSHTARITSIAWGPDDGQLATGGLDRTVRLWDLDSAKEIGEPLEQGGSVTSIQWSNNTEHSRLCVATNAGTVHLREPVSGHLTLTLKVPNLTVSDAQWNSDGSCIAAANGNVINIWDARRRNKTSRQSEAASQPTDG